MLLDIIEWYYLIAASVGTVVCCFLLFRVDQARQRRAGAKRNGSLKLMIRRFGVAYTLKGFALLTMFLSALFVLSGIGKGLVVPLLALQPGILTALVIYEWHNDAQIIHLRKMMRQKNGIEEYEDPPGQPH